MHSYWNSIDAQTFFHHSFDGRFECSHFYSNSKYKFNANMKEYGLETRNSVRVYIIVVESAVFIIKTHKKTTQIVRTIVLASKRWGG